MDLSNSPIKPLVTSRKHPPLVSLENNKNDSTRDVFKSHDNRVAPFVDRKRAAVHQEVGDENASPSKKRDLFIPQTYKATKNRVERTCLRPTTGGKTVAAMKYLQNKRNNIDERRLSAEQLKLLSRRIDPSAPLQSPHSSPVKPALPSSLSQQSNHHHHHQPSSSSLYQTCMAIWANSPPSLDLRHENIKYLSELLKIRLCQAKIRALASLDDELPQPTKPKRIRLPRKRHQPAPPNTRTVSGNGTRLRLHRHEEADKKRKQLKKTATKKPKDSKESKLKKKNANAPKQTRKSKAPQPVTLEDGRRVYVCESCGKKYKNRNGLAYHRDRCKFKQQEDNSSQQQYELEEEDNEEPFEATDGIKCVCEKPTEDRGTMIQCDKCQMWQHLKCVGVDQKDIADDYTCPYCSKDTPAAASQSQLLDEMEEEEEEEDELAEDDEEMDELVTMAAEDTQEDVVDVKPVDQALAPEWEDILFSQDSIRNMSEPWTKMSGSSQDEQAFSSSWNFSDLGLLQPPSLLFSDNTMADDDSSNLLPSDVIPADASCSDMPAASPDSLWYQFANFEDDYQCEETN
ncbi:hypothetical protein BJV82DRAFT_626894 [Fennellomyces sp. T-0311]|nr:hypothetical protein BJV82DRAFT_626894 [Fennellomyces sp. T-0311]